MVQLTSLIGPVPPLVVDSGRCSKLCSLQSLSGKWKSSEVGNLLGRIRVGNVSCLPRAFSDGMQTRGRREGSQWPAPKMWMSETGRRKGKKKRHSERIKSILISLNELKDEEFEEGLQQWIGKLNVKEQAVILNEQRSWSRALALFSWLQGQDDYTPNVFNYNIVIKALGRARKFQLVEQLWEEMEGEGVEPTNVSYSTLIDAYSKAGLPEKALKWLEDMKMRGFEPDAVTMNAAIHVHKLSGNVAAAEKLLQTFSWDVETCNTMIDMYGRVGQYTDASKTFSDILNSDNIAPNTCTFNTMINVCGLAGKLEEAECFLWTMKKRGLLPDVATFNTFIAMFANNGNLQKSLAYLSMMKEAKIVPDRVSFHTLLNAFALRDMVSEVEALIQEMNEVGFIPGEVVTVGLARMYIRAGLVEKAQRTLSSFTLTGYLSSSSLAAVIDSYGEQLLWREAEELFLQCQKRWNVSIFNTTIKAYGLSGLHGKAWELFSSMEGSKVLPDDITFSTVIHSLAAMSPVDAEKVERVKIQMHSSRHKLQRSSFNALIGAYGRLGKMSEAKQIFEEMAAAGVEPDKVSYGTMVNAYAKLGLVKEAQREVLSMREAGFAPDKFVFTSLMKLYSKTDDQKELEKAFEVMGGSGVQPDLFAANFLMHLYGKVGNLKEAERIFDQLEGNIGELSVNEVSLTIILDVYKRSGRLYQALGIANRMLTMDYLKDIVAFNSILGLYKMLGRVREAMDVFQLMSRRNVKPDMLTYSTMAGILKQAGSVQEALDLFAGSIGLTNTVQSLTMLVSLYARLGLVDESFEACEKLWHGGLVLDNPAYNAMIHAYGTAGRFDESLRLFMEMQTRGLVPDVVTYTTVITVYGKAGLLEGVTRIFKRMRRAGCEPNLATYKVVINIYKDAGKMDLAAMVQQEMQFAQYLQQEGMYGGGILENR